MKPSLNRAFSLIELVTAMTISIILLSLTTPGLTKMKKDGLFRNFASQLAGHLTAVRRTAQLTEKAAAMEFEPEANLLYSSFIWEAQRWKQTSQQAPDQVNYEIGLGLPSEDLMHPTRPGLLNRALNLTHGSRLIFGAEGSGSGSVVFSDEDGRCLCLVVSGQTGRFRIYTKMGPGRDWRLYY